jgi:hypothetical protein
MCGLCAALGGSRFWTDTAGREEFAADGRPVSLMLERSGRVALLNMVLSTMGVRVSDWAGSSYVLEDAAGNTRNAYNLMEIWEKADELSTRPVDPIDPQIVQQLTLEARTQIP